MFSTVTQSAAPTPRLVHEIAEPTLQAPTTAATATNEANAIERIRSSLELHLQAARRRRQPRVRRRRLLLGLDDEQDDAGGQGRATDGEQHVGRDGQRAAEAGFVAQ